MNAAWLRPCDDAASPAGPRVTDCLKLVNCEIADSDQFMT